MKAYAASLTISLALASALSFTVAASAQSSATQNNSSTARQMPMGSGMGYGRMMDPQIMGYGMMGGMGMGLCGGGGGMMGGMAMLRYPDGTLAFLKAELKITNAQTPAWENFAKAMRANTASMQEMWTQMRRGWPQTLPAALDRHEAMMTTGLKALRDMKTALTPLYDSLDADQKHTADALFVRCHNMGRGIGQGRRMPAQ